MSVEIILNGVSHDVPTNDEIDWGADVTGYLQDIADVLDGTFQTVTASTGSTAIDFNLGKNVRLLLNASTTLTFTHPRGGRPAYFYIKQGGSFTVTWPTIKWRGGSAPTITTGSGKRDVVCLMYEPTDAVYLGEYAQNFA